MRLDKLSRHGVILNHKNPRRLFRLCTGLADSGAGLSQSRGSRQGEKEATSLARLALETELAALQFNQALGDGQAQARTFCGLTGLRETVEGVKDALLLLGGNSRPGIAHLHSDLAVRLVSYQFDAAACGREFDGVANQVHEHLLESRGVGADGEPGCGKLR